MIFQFVLLNMLVVSAATILFVFIRTLPRIEDGEVSKQNVFERWLTSEFPEKLDQFFSGIFMRTLRRTKVLVLKADNALNKKIENLKLHGNEPFKGEKPDISALTKEEELKKDLPE